MTADQADDASLRKTTTGREDIAVLHYDESLPTGAEDNARVPSGDGTNRRGTTVKLDSDKDRG